MSALPRRGSPRARALFEQHYQFRAQYEGDADAKKDAAGAKRVATGLRNAVRDFGRLLTEQQQAVMREAAAVMEALGADLDTACGLARVCQTERTAADLAARHAAADAVANQRWVDNEAMRSEVADLAAFVDQAFATESEQWVVAQHPGCARASFPDDMPPGGRLIDMLKRPAEGGAAAATLTLRRRAAEYLAALRTAERRASRRYGDTWYVGADDYEAWRTWRQQVLAAIRPAKES